MNLATPCRNLTIDGLKYVAAAAIVLHHVAAYAGGQVVGGFRTAPLSVVALFFFFAVAGYFHGALGTRGWSWMRARFVRLAVPYAFWSAVYLVWMQRGLITGSGPHRPDWLHVIFFAGAHEVLWSLPLLLICAVVVEVVVKSTAARRTALVAMATVAVAILWTAPLEQLSSNPYQYFYFTPRWLALYLAGMELRAWGCSRSATQAERVAPWAAALVLAWLSFSTAGLHGPATATATAVLAAITALGMLSSASAGVDVVGASRLGWGGSYLLGIYVSHVLALEAVEIVVPVSQSHPGLWVLGVWLVCLAGCTVMVATMRRHRYTRFLVS